MGHAYVQLQMFSKWFYQFTLPPTACGQSSSSMSSPTLVSFIFLIFSILVAVVLQYFYSLTMTSWLMFLSGCSKSCPLIHLFIQKTTYGVLLCQALCQLLGTHSWSCQPYAHSHSLLQIIYWQHQDQSAHGIQTSLKIQNISSLKLSLLL